MRWALRRSRAKRLDAVTSAAAFEMKRRNALRLLRPTRCSRISRSLSSGRPKAGPVGSIRATGPLLPRQLDREFPISDPLGQAFGIAGRGILAIGRNQFAERSEHAELRHAVAVDARQASLDPGLLETIECGLLLLVVR